MNPATMAPVDAASSLDPAWARTARAWGSFAGVAFVIATVAFVVEATGMLASAPDYVSTSAGQVVDEAAFHIASLAYQQQVLWDYVLRDGLYFFAYLALIPLGLGLREVVGRRRVAPQLAAAFLVVAAIFGCMNAFETFVMVDYWRSSGWAGVPAGVINSVGRDLDLMDGLTRWTSNASFAALAVALWYVGRACRASTAMPDWLAATAYAGAALLAALLAVSLLPDTATVQDLPQPGHRCRRRAAVHGRRRRPRRARRSPSGPRGALRPQWGGSSATGVPVMSRLLRPRVAKLHAQRTRTSSRFWKPMSQTMWMVSQSIQATNPVSRKRRKSATARSRPIVASSPRSLKWKGSRVRPSSDAVMRRAA